MATMGDGASAYQCRVIGKRFVLGDVVLNLIDPLPDYGSGIQLIGIGEIGAYDLADVLYKQRFLKSYHLTGMLGQASSNGLSTGPVIYRSPWRHITQPKLDRVLASIEFKARSALLLQAGLVANTQKAFEALSSLDRTIKVLKPLVEPRESLPPDHVTSYWDRRPEPTQPHSLRASPDPSSLPQFPPSLHAIRCVNFKPPFFTLEIQVIYETDEFLVDLLVNIGASLRSSCVLLGARRVRHGPFIARNSLLLKQCVVPQTLYERFARIRSEPPEREFGDEDEYRRHILSELVVDDETNLFSNLVNCTLCHRF
ncbi:Mitochondrial mRNA pseudouridine synthase Trub2 [Taenia crassiceps]|uniref:Mitochondrial mRNA pseudouridine synthase Trub2 n=1 Tax=Taenia crassiceps TaxID=6207 RepID=A0ABR4QEG6_9CEST